MVMPVAEFNDSGRDGLETSRNYNDYEREEHNKHFLAASFCKSDNRYTSTEEELLISGRQDEKASTFGETLVNPEPSRGRKWLLMLACLYVQFSVVGMTIALGVIYVELIEAFQAPRSQAALVQSLYMGTAIGGGVVFSRIIHRFDVGICVILASFIGTVCLLASSFVGSLTVIIVLVGFVLGLAQSLNYLASFAVVNWTFPKSRKSALACLSLGQGVGQFSIPYLTGALVDEYRWTGAFFVLAGLMTLQCLPVGLLMYVSRKYFHKGSPQANEQKSDDVPMFKDIPFILYLTAYLAFAGLGPVEQMFVVDLAVLKGFTKNEGATLLSVNGICGIIGRFFGAFLMHKFSRLDPGIVLIVGFMVWAIAHVWIVNAAAYWVMVLGMIVRGLCAGQVLSNLPASQIELRGAHRYAQSVAVSNFAGGAAQIFGGFFGGYTYDITGGYNLIFYIASGTSVYSSLCMVIVLLLHKRLKRQNKYEQIVG